MLIGEVKDQKVQYLSKSGKTQISIIIPTLNEGENIDVLIEQLIGAFRTTAYSVEILIADGGSIDATQSKVEAWASLAPVRFVCTNSGRGLTGDVLAAAHETCGDVIVVMDADLSHSPEIAAVLAKLVLDGECDMAIGSRYVRGGATPDWPWVRRMISRIAGLLARPFVDVRDPTSGFFSIRREKLLTVDPNAKGFKIVLEVLFSAGYGFRVKEIPICFRDRSLGHSKMNMKQAGIYLCRLMVLAGSAGAASNVIRSTLAGLAGLAVDLGISNILWSNGIRLSIAHIFSFFIASAANYALNSQWAFRLTTDKRLDSGKYIKFLTVGLIALLLRCGALTLFAQQFSLPANVALIVAIFVTAVVNYLGCAFFVFSRRIERMCP